jgi:hypothetical protein
MKPQRRDFLKQGSLAVISLAMLARTLPSSAQAKPLPRLSESDPLAVKLGYRHDATKVDKKKFANWQPRKDCDDCLHYEGRKGQAWGPCTIFPGKAVNAKGWCAEFQPKKA